MQNIRLRECQTLEFDYENEIKPILYKKYKKKSTRVINYSLFLDTDKLHFCALFVQSYERDNSRESTIRFIFIICMECEF